MFSGPPNFPARRARPYISVSYMRLLLLLISWLVLVHVFSGPWHLRSWLARLYMCLIYASPAPTYLIYVCSQGPGSYELGGKTFEDMPSHAKRVSNTHTQTHTYTHTHRHTDRHRHRHTHTHTHTHTNTHTHTHTHTCIHI